MELWERIGILILALVFLVVGILALTKLLFNPFGEEKSTNNTIKFKGMGERLKEFLNSIGINNVEEGIKKEELSRLLVSLSSKFNFCYIPSDNDDSKFYGYFEIQQNSLIIHLLDNTLLKEGKEKEEIVNIPFNSKESLYPIIQKDNKWYLPLDINKWKRKIDRFAFLENGKFKKEICFINGYLGITTKRKIGEENAEIIISLPEGEIKNKFNKLLQQITLKDLKELIENRDKIIFIENTKIEENMTEKDYLPTYFIEFYYKLLYYNFSSLFCGNMDIFQYIKYIQQIKNREKEKEYLPSLLCGNIIERDNLNNENEIYQNEFMDYYPSNGILVINLPSKEKKLFEIKVPVYFYEVLINKKEKKLIAKKMDLTEICQKMEERVRYDIGLNRESKKNIENKRNTLKVLKIKNFFYIIFYSNEEYKNKKLSDLLREGFGIGFPISNKENFILIKEKGELISIFGKENIHNFDSLPITVLENGIYTKKLNELEDGKYKVYEIINHKIKKEDGSTIQEITIKLKKID